MTKQLYLISLLLACNLLFGQNWRVIPNTQDSMTFAGGATIYTSIVDSFYTQLGSNYWILDNDVLALAGPNQNCPASLSEGFLGHKIEQNDSVIRFIFYADTVTLTFNSASLNVFFGDSLLITPTATYADTLFNGQIDSLKEFAIQFIGTKNYFFGSGYSFILSKNNGLIQFPHIFNPLLFPLNGPGTYGNIQRIDLMYPRKRDFYYYDVGDEFHFVEWFRINNSITLWDDLVNYTVLSKTSGLNSISYSVLKNKYHSSYSYNPYSVIKTYSSDTVIWQYSQLDEYLFPSVTQRQFPGNIGGTEYIQLNQDTLGLFTIDYFGREGMFYPFPCVSSYFDISPRYETFKQGFGRTKYEKYLCDRGYCDIDASYLVYAKKQSGSFGSPQYIGIDEEESTVLGFYPNPATDQITISNISSIQIEWQIADLSGRILLSGMMSKQNNTIDIKTLSSGLYLLVLPNRKAIKIVKN